MKLFMLYPAACEKELEHLKAELKRVERGRLILTTSTEDPLKKIPMGHEIYLLHPSQVELSQLTELRRRQPTSLIYLLAGEPCQMPNPNPLIINHYFCTDQYRNVGPVVGTIKQVLDSRARQGAKA